VIYGGHFDPKVKKDRIKELETLMNNPNFWDDKNHSEEVLNELNYLKSKLVKVEELKNNIESNLEMLDMLKENSDEELLQLVISDIDKIGQDLENAELELLLSAPYDKCDCILEIHPGAGGTESCDWASILYRMYTRWCEKNNKKIELLDYQDGEEAGIKSVSFIVHGINSYGYLKNEKGVHRLIRISPFDSNSRRHTSFASIDITPLYNNVNIDIEIKDSDIRVDTFCASGHGGQGVNTTPSAVRITHFPSKIVVTCQNERSQIRNKETCMTVLKNKLYQLEVERREKELKSIKGENTEINFGSQIRTYTMCPYTLVKDHRTNTENANVLKVLDGDIDKFIYDNLKLGVK
jgi:peptide chain release factor 2